MIKTIGFCFLLSVACSVLQAQTGMYNNNPQAQLDIFSTDAGLLIPRLALTARNVAAPVTVPDTSEIIYNTATGGVAPNAVSPGFYYWDGDEWIRLATSADEDADWLETDSTKADNVNDDIFTSGNVGINTQTPAANLDINGSIKIGSGGSVISQMQGGKVNVGASGGQFIVIYTITFPAAFINPPKVVCTASEQPGTIFDDSFNITTRQITITQFTLVVNRTDGDAWGQAMEVHWFAFD